MSEAWRFLEISACSLSFESPLKIPRHLGQLLAIRIPIPNACIISYLAIGLKKQVNTAILLLIPTAQQTFSALGNAGEIPLAQFPTAKSYHCTSE
jgi:hypothetical protein